MVSRDVDPVLAALLPEATGAMKGYLLCAARHPFVNQSSTKRQPNVVDGSAFALIV